MAAVKTEDPTSSLDTPSNCVDPLDIEQYINPDTLTFTSPSMSPDPSSFKSLLVTPTPSSQPFVTPQLEQSFSGPSHQYEQYRQQSSLPVGAVANTFALNESSHYSFDQDDFDLIPPTNYLGVNSTDDYLDLGGGSEQADMDMDFNMQPHHLPSMSDAINTPHGAQPASSSASSQHVRAWPGMHQQAAMQAKAQAEAQAQRQQQIRQHSVSHSRESPSAHLESDNPHVEESISRLLNRMRHSSVSSSHADDHATPGHSSYLHNSRSRKDEDDMDEDERLLASEEGKKLNSKERRQLRNKVSARAFRSRRKEYIGQLEGELAAKAAEADRFRIRNDQLVAENTRLTDLTRMLLSSPHFSSFLDELSTNRVSLPALPQISSQQHAQHPQQPDQPAPVSKDMKPSAHQQNLHVGLAMIPESPYELNHAQPINTGWAQNKSAYDQRVYAVTSIPDEPVIDTFALSGKSTVEPSSSFGCTKDDPPEFEAMPMPMPEPKSIDLPAVSQPSVEEHEPREDVVFDESDPAFALFADERPTSSHPVNAQPSIEPEDRIFGDIALEKALGRFDIVVARDSVEAQGEVSAAVIEKFERMRSRMDWLGARIDAVTSQL